jgi:hypothetical protein
VILDEVAPVLQSRDPKAEVERVDEPQLSLTLTTGVEGVVFGEAVPLPAELEQPSTLWVTVYVPGVPTVILDEVAPVLHSKTPEAFVDKVEVPSHLSDTVTTGVEGIVFGAAVPLPALLVQLLTV